MCTQQSSSRREASLLPCSKVPALFRNRARPCDYVIYRSNSLTYKARYIARWSPRVSRNKPSWIRRFTFNVKSPRYAVPRRIRQAICLMRFGVYGLRRAVAKTTVRQSSKSSTRHVGSRILWGHGRRDERIMSSLGRRLDVWRWSKLYLLGLICTLHLLLASWIYFFPTLNSLGGLHRVRVQFAVWNETARFSFTKVVSNDVWQVCAIVAVLPERSRTRTCNGGL